MGLYLDGVPTSSTGGDLGHPIVPCQVLLGRLSTVPLGERDDSRWFHGRGFAGLLDEVAIHDHGLSIEEIRRHHRSATRRVRDDRTAGPGRQPGRPPDRAEAASVGDRRDETREK